MTIITCIDDLKRLHQRRVPKMFWDYAESGSYTEQTFRENCSDFSKIRLRQRVAVDMSDRKLATEMIGQPVTMPVALAPVGSTGMQSADGEIKAARAAEKFGVPFTLSTMSICSIEDVAANTTKPFWFQLYVMRDEEFVDEMIERAKRAVLGPGPDTRPADPRPAPQGHQEWPFGAAEADASEHPEHDDQTALVPWHAWDETAQLRQHRRACEECGRPCLAIELDQRAVRPAA